MSVLWPTLVKKKPATISHTTYLFPSSDALMYYEEAIASLLWEASAPTTLANFSQTSAGAGDVWTTTSSIYVPAAPSPAGATGNYRTVMDTVVKADGNNGVHSNVAISEVYLISSSPEIYQDTEYVWKGVTLGGMLMYQREVALTDYSVTDVATRYYYEGRDEEGEWIKFKVDAYADYGTTRYCKTQIEVTSLTNEAEYNDGGEGWAGVQGETTASYKDNSSTNLGDAMQAIAHTGDTIFGITRSFFTFDTDVISGDRTVTAAEFQITGFGYNESDCILQTSTHPVAEGVISYTGYRSYGDVVSSVIDWQLWDGGNPYRHEVALNSTGSSYVQTQMDAGNQAKFCLREYDHDYLNVAPTGDARYRNGCAYSEMPPVGIYVLSPALKVTYNKVPDWDDRTAEANWSPFGGTTWNGTGWDSSAGGYFGLDTSGTWMDDKRWAAVKITFTGVDELTMYFEDNDDIVIDGDTIISDQVFTIPWRWDTGNSDYDFYYWYILSGGTPFTISSIQFLER